MAHTMDQEREEEFREAFAECDTNDNGTICFAEFTTLMNNLDADMTQEEYQIGFREIDRNRDGAIDFDEFFAWWVEH